MANSSDENMGGCIIFVIFQIILWGGIGWFNGWFEFATTKLTATQLNTASQQNTPIQPNGTFWEAVQNEDWALMRRWIEYDQSLVNSKGVFTDHVPVFNLGKRVDSPIVRRGMTPLALATMRENLEMVQFLTSNGADPNVYVEGGGGFALTPLHIAALKSRYDLGYDAIVQQLIACGADVNAKTADVMTNGRTPLDMIQPDNPKTDKVFRLILRAGGITTTDEDIGKWYTY